MSREVLVYSCACGNPNYATVHFAPCLVSEFVAVDDPVQIGGRWARRILVADDVTGLEEVQ